MKKDEIVEIAKAVGIKYNPVLQEFHSEFCNGLNLEDLEEFIDLQKKFKDSDLSWSIDISSINQESWDLSVKNPNANDEVIHKNPEELIRELEEIDVENKEILNRIKSLL